MKGEEKNPQGRKTRFVKGRRKTREKRERISLVKESNLYYQQGSEQRKTIAGCTLPSYKTGYVHGLLGTSVDKIYGDKLYLKGMNKRPRMKLTLGNMVMMKQRKRVEEVDRINQEVLGGQRVRQRIRVVWDRLNVQIRKRYRRYRKSHPRDGRREEEKDKRSKKVLLNLRGIYKVVRECEAYRNAYELRSIYTENNRGKRLKEGRLREKFGRRSRTTRTNEVKTGKRESGVRDGRRTIAKTEKILREDLHGKRKITLKKTFKKKFKKRKDRLGKYPERWELEHIERLAKRSQETRLKVGQRKNREERPQGRRNQNLEEDMVEGVKESKERDEEAEGLREASTTQYFAKPKNLRRIVKILREENERGKRRKVPEKERTERHPDWMELDKWSDERMQKVEDKNLKKVLNGEEVDRSYATYRELGKKVRFLYGAERSERWIEKTKG